MKIIVPVKRVIDAYVKVRIKADGSGVETVNVKMAMNPFDEIALEEALRLREAGVANQVVVVSLGPLEVQEILRAALALGADNAIHVQTDTELQPLAVAKLLQAIVQKEAPGLVIMGKQAIDDDCNQTGQMLAGLLNWGQGTFASKVVVKPEQVFVTREIDGGSEIIALKLPAVITADLRLNQPRYATLPNIMKAKSKALQIISAEQLGVDLTPRWRTLKVTAPLARQAGVKVSSPQELVTQLRTAGMLQ